MSEITAKEEALCICRAGASEKSGWGSRLIGILDNEFAYTKQFVICVAQKEVTVGVV